MAASTQPRPGQVGAGDRVPGGDGRDDGGDVAVGFGAHLDPGQLLPRLRGQVPEADQLAGVVVDDGVVVVPVVPEPHWCGSRRRVGRPGHDRHPEGDLRGDVHVPQQQVTERVRAGLRHRQLRVHRPVLPGEGLDGRPRGSTRRGRQRREPLRQPVHPRPDLHGAALPGLRGVRGDLVRGHPRRHRPGGTGHPGRVHRRQPRCELGIHPQARLDVETGAGLDDLVRRGDRQVPREHEVPHRREPLTECRAERGLPTGEPLGHPGRQAHLRRGHRVDVPDRVDPLPRTRLPHRGLHPSTPRTRHGLGTLGRVHDALQLTRRARTPPRHRAPGRPRPAHAPPPRTPHAAPRCGC